jgi:hypothetical protein
MEDLQATFVRAARSARRGWRAHRLSGVREVAVYDRAGDPFHRRLVVTVLLHRMGVIDAIGKLSVRRNKI